MKSRSNRSPEIDTTTLLFHLFSLPPLLSLSPSSLPFYSLFQSLPFTILFPFLSLSPALYHSLPDLRQTTISPYRLNSYYYSNSNYNLLTPYHLSFLPLPDPLLPSSKWPQQPSKVTNKMIKKEEPIQSTPNKCKEHERNKTNLHNKQIKTKYRKKTMNWQPERERYKLHRRRKKLTWKRMTKVYNQN